LCDAYQSLLVTSAAPASTAAATGAWLAPVYKGWGKEGKLPVSIVTTFCFWQTGLSPGQCGVAKVPPSATAKASAIHHKRSTAMSGMAVSS
jgi:hypothetical protein